MRLVTGRWSSWVGVRRLGTLLATVALGFSLAACGNQGQSPGATKPANQLTVGYTALVPTGIYPQMADKLGYFKREGLDVKFVMNSDPSAGVRGLIGGSLDVLASGSEAIIAAQKGAEVQFVGATANGSIFNLVTDPEITDLKQLEGKAIGVPSLQSITVVAIQQALVAHGVDLGTVHFVATGVSPKSVAALRGGQISACAVSAPYNSVAAAAGFTDWGSTDKLGAKPLLSAVLVTDKNWAASHETELEAFLRAVQSAVRDVYDPSKTAEMVDLMHQFINTDPNYLRTYIQDLVAQRANPNLVTPLDLHTDQAVFQSTTQGFTEIGVLPKDTDPVDLANKSIEPKYAAKAFQ
jgi:ABC-type nitrate/sulfonate/bicarbonate transport system substrate-binding protein